jgi:hypothetical protein
MANEIDEGVVKSQEEEVTSQETSAEATVNAEGQESETKVEDPYAEQLSVIEKLKVESKQKGGALKEEREKRKALEERLASLEEKLASSGSADEDQVLSKAEKLVEEKLANQRFIDKLEQFSGNPKEQQLIKHHYENSIRRTGDVIADLKMAVAIANQHLVEKAKSEQSAQIDNEATVARSMKGGIYSRNETGESQQDLQVKAFLKRIGAGDTIK